MTRMTTFKISEASLAIRKRNILLGALFSVVLVAIIVSGHMHSPQTYNEVLLWSMVGFLGIGNLVNYYRYRRYMRRVKNHRLEVTRKSVDFWTEGEKSVMRFDKVAALVKHRRRGKLSHLQIKLRNNRGIRLEGYESMEDLSECLEEHIPKAHVMSG